MFDVRPAALPWLTPAIALACTALYLLPAHALPALAYDRDLILTHGALHRLWTSHLAHFSPSHLLWNLAVFVPTGLWLERLTPARARLLCLLTPLLTGLALLLFEPRLDTFAGLSGLATATTTLLALTQLRHAAPRDRLWWRLLLTLIVLKLLLEFLHAAPLFATFAPSSDLPTPVSGPHPLPLAHLAGIVSALVVHFGSYGKQRAAHSHV